MHSSLVRLQNAFGFFTSVAFAVACCVAFSVLLSPETPSAKIEMRSTQVVKGRPHYYSTKKEEYAHIKFDLEADLTSLFTWNTKQVFVWVQATWPDPASTSSKPLPPAQAVIWDLIINSPSQLDPPNPLHLIFPPDKPTSKSKSKSKAKAKKAKQTPTQPGIISLKNQKPKYQITQSPPPLRPKTGGARAKAAKAATQPVGIASQRNVTLELGYNVQPWVGALTWVHRSPLRHGLLGAGSGVGAWERRGARWARWQRMAGGVARAFDLPALKGQKKKDEDKVRAGAGKAEP